MPDPTRKRFGYGQLWPLRPACNHNLSGLYIIILLCRIRLRAPFSVPFFQRRHRSYCAKPTWIRSGWPGQCLAKPIWSESKKKEEKRKKKGSHPQSSDSKDCTYQWATAQTFMIPRAFSFGTLQQSVTAATCVMVDAWFINQISSDLNKLDAWACR